MSGDPVSWLMVEPGWTVVDAHGKKIGKVDEVLGDEQIDIFHGLLVDGEEILAERVAEIREGEITLALDGSEVCRASRAGNHEADAAQAALDGPLRRTRRRRDDGRTPRRLGYLARCDRREAPGEAMKGDGSVESGADKLEELSNKAAAKGGVAAKVAPELADDAAFLRKLKPSLMVKRAKGELPKDAEPGTPAPQAPSGPAALAAEEARRRPESDRGAGGGLRRRHAAREGDRLEGSCPPAPLSRIPASARPPSRSPSMRARSRS